MTSDHTTPFKRFKNPALRISLIYLAVGALWILFSDKLAAQLGDQQLITTISIFKGWLFVATTCAIFYYLIRNKFAEIESARQQTSVSEMRFRTLFNKSPVPLAYLTKNSNVAKYNERFFRLFGYTPDEISTLDRWWQLAYPAPEYRAWAQETWDTAVKKAAADGSDIEPIEYDITCKDGTIRTVQISGIILDDIFISTFFDVTGLKRAEEAATNSNKLLKIVIDTVPVRVFWKDAELNYLGCNHAFARDAGVEGPDDLIGKNDYQLGWKDQAELYRADDRGVIESGIPRLSYDEPQTTPDGTQMWLRTSKVPLRNENKENIGVLGIYEDITERKNAEKELQQKNADIEQFIYTVSHDLRTPLVTVKTFLGYLEMDIAKGDQSRVSQDLQFIHDAADKMRMQLDELLEMSRIDHVENPPVSTPLLELLKDVTNDMAGIIYERKVNIHLPESNLMLFGDRLRLCQIWQNLIENAIKYCPDDIIPCIELDVCQSDGETVFSVKDNGIGIDPQYRSKIFGIFEKLDPKSPGAGMGLALVQRIIEKCGGRIWVESEENGKGSSFFFTLPQAMVQS